MGVWSVDSGSEGAVATCLHLHHHGGLPRCVDLPHLCCIPRTSQRCLFHDVEDKKKDIRQSFSPTSYNHGKEIIFVLVYIAWMHTCYLYLILLLQKNLIVRKEEMKTSGENDSTLGKETLTQIL